MILFDMPDYAGHEQVAMCYDPATGLRAIIAVHSTVLGPAAGGCRRRAYSNADEGLRDVLRLSEAMTYKNALAGLPLGGGKSVILADPETDPTPELLAAFAKCVNRFGGSYYTAEDMGMGLQEIRTLAKNTQYTFGSTDPSPYTALGVFHGIRAAVLHRLGRRDLEGLHVLVQGVGNVGRALCRHLAAAGAKLWVADTRHVSVTQVADEFDAEPVSCDAIFGPEVDVFAPCGPGGVIDDAAVTSLRASIVAGAANNQLAAPRHGESLRQRNVLYAPDYVINAGGMMHAGQEIVAGGASWDASEKIEGIFATVSEIFDRADRDGVATNVVADRLARELVAGRGPAGKLASVT